MAEVRVQDVATDVKAGEWSGGTFPYRVGHRKLGMWLFIMSDSLTFTALLIGYSYVRVASDTWPKPFQFSPSIIFSSLMTLVLLSSSLTMVMAVMAANRRKKRSARRWILATMVLGSLFVILHGYEWKHLIEDEGVTPSGNQFMLARTYDDSGHLIGERVVHVKPEEASEMEMETVNEQGQTVRYVQADRMFGAAFFGITGLHMFHVLTGVMYLGVIAARIKKFTAEDVEVSGLYWHFVDLVWMFVFPLIYLLSVDFTPH
jgi:cytochrome c oxidase subunit 3